MTRGRGRPVSAVLTAIAATMALCTYATAGVQEPDLGAPGPEHDVLRALEGSWFVTVGDEVVGSASADLRLGNRFLEVELVADSGPIRHAVYTFGFDRRHGVYTVVAFDSTGTYWVTAKGEAEGGRIAMYGEDDDPVMRSMGLDKEFVIVLHVHSQDRFSIETLFVDTRTPARTEQPFTAFHLDRDN